MNVLGKNVNVRFVKKLVLMLLYSEEQTVTDEGVSTIPGCFITKFYIKNVRNLQRSNLLEFYRKLYNLENSII